jgi:cephalosporin hydroxylase
MANRFSLREWIMMMLIVVLTATVILEELGYMYRPAEQEVVDRFHKLFYDSDIWKSTKWLGVRTAQNPNDAWIHQEIIAQVKPDFIVETGTWHGGSAALWATILQQVNPDGRVITLDINDNVSAAKELPIVKDKVEFLLGSSVDPAIVAQVTKRVQGKKVLVILDSDHHKNHVLAEMKTYAPLVSIDSYMIVQDTNANGHPVLEKFGPGPMEAVNEFLATNDQFRPDREAERLMFTMHPKGYLKRIK